MEIEKTMTEEEPQRVQHQVRFFHNILLVLTYLFFYSLFTVDSTSYTRGNLTAHFLLAFNFFYNLGV